MDTIYALSSGAPPAAIAIVRLSGERAFAVAEALAGRLPTPRVAALRQLHDPATGVLLDRALVILFPGPDSATGEDVCELHLHGGRAVVAAVQGALAERGLRPAEPGEFTRRALLSGRIDLTEAEGLGDLLAAETEAQRRAALSSAEGGLRRRIEAWTEQVVQLAADVEALLDFSDEDDVAARSAADMRTEIAALVDEIEQTVSGPPVERLRDGIRVVIAGPPNSGKSTLLNALVEREAAIVSSIAGTTRDVIEANVVHGGVAYLLLDTAGLRLEAGDAIEAVGIAHASAAIERADILLWLGDLPPERADALWLHSRADLPGREELPAGPSIAVSVASGLGLETLWRCLNQRAGELLPRANQLALNERQRLSAGECAGWLRSAIDHQDPLIVAENLRLARRALDQLTGRTDVEAVLDVVFSRFCIGK